MIHFFSVIIIIHCNFSMIIITPTHSEYLIVGHFKDSKKYKKMKIYFQNIE